MGAGLSSGCCSCRTSHAYQVEERARGRGHETVRVVSIGERREERVVLRVLGQIWQLVKEPERDRDELVWKPCHLSDVHLKLTLVEDDSGDVLEYVLEEENNEVPSLFTAHLTTDSKVIRTGDQFVQWKESHSSSCVLYGVSFMSTRDTLHFISACTALFPELQDKITSPLYPPPPQSLLSPSRKQAPPTYTSTPLHPNHHITSNQIPLSSSLDWSLSALHTSNTSPDNKFHRSNSLTLDGEGCQLLAVRRKDEDSEVPSARWHTGVEQLTLGDAYQTALSRVEDLKDGVPEQKKLTHSSSLSSMESLKKSDSQESEDFEGDDSDSDEEDDEEGVVTSIDDAEYPELFQPTQALEVSKILEDIMEEEEEEEEGERRNGVEDRKMRGKLRHSSIRQTRATSELEPVLQDFDQLLNDLRASQLLELTTSQRESYRLSRQSSLREPPILPSSQPPGPILAPQRSLVPDSAGDRNRMSIEMTPELRNALTRLSTISLEGNPPPQLPISPPPGQHLSPEPSMTFEQYHQKPIAAQSIEEEDEEAERRAGASNGDLPPPLSRRDSLEESHNSSTRLHLTPSFLRSITPPEEFGDSGVPVTSDEESGGRHSWLSSRQGHVSQHLFKRTSSQMSSELSEVEQATGSIRKTGWLEVKGVLVRKNKKVAMKSKRRWKKHWTVMKGLTVLLYQCDKPSELEEDAHPDLRLDIERCLVTPLLDHLTRDHVFCISTSSGNTYYLQTASQGELDDWITVLHSAAGIAMTMKPSKQAAAGMLETLLVETNIKIDEEERLRKMAELQLMAVSDYTSKSNITKQLAVFAENLEYLNMELFRIKCYLAALQGTEQPNPQLVLTTVSKPTKSILGKVGVFSVSSLHAVVSCRFSNRSPVDQHSLTKSLSSTTLLSPGKWKGLKLWRRSARSSSQSTLPRAKRKLLSSPSISKPYPSMGEDEEPTHKEVVETELAMRSGFGVSLTVELPNSKTCVVPLRSDMTVQHILQVCCKKAGLDPDDHFIRLKTVADEGQFLCESPHHDELLGNLYYSAVEVCQKSIRTVCISQPSTDGDTTTGVGVRLQPLKGDHSVLSKLLVVGVVEGSLADRHGICENDEILLINDTAVNQLTLPEVKTAFKEPSISITVRSCHVEAPFAMPAGGSLLISDLVIPAPRSHGSWISKETLGGLIVPKPYLDDLTRIDSVENLTADDDVPEFTRGRVTDLIKGSLEVTGLVDRWRAYEMAPSPIMGDAPKMTREQRLMKVVRELLETEREHVKSLELTLERYLDPLQVENFIPHDEMSRIHADISHITDQQRQFLQNLENLSSTCEEEDKESTKVIVLSVVTEFLSHVETFRQYSHFCASRHRLGRLMAAVSPPEQLQLFLDARNPKGDPALMLESLLIRPIVRVMRYSLFLQAMKELSENGTDEREQLTEAITAMTQVARYINEVQKVSELYAHLFDDLLLKSGLAEFGVSVQVSQLLYHSVGMWLSHGQISKGWKKGQGPKLHCFVFTTAVVLLSIDREHQRRGSKGAGQSSSLTIDDVTHSSLLPLPRCKVEDLPDSDGVTNMWQILYQHNGQLATYLIRSSSLEEKGVFVHVLRKAIQDQVALYGSLSLPVSPVQSAAPSLYTGQSSPSCDDHMLSSPRTITTPTALSTDSDNEQTFL